MSTIGGVGDTTFKDPTTGVDKTPLTTGAGTGGTTVPPASGDATLPDASGVGALPLLTDPKIGGLSMEQLVKALGLEGRNIAVKTGLADLKAKGEERAEASRKQIEEIRKNIAAMEAKKKVSPVKKAFKWLGMIVGAIASAVTIAVGVVTANPLMVAGGVALAVMSVNSIVSEATDGKYSIGAGVAAIAKKCGASDKVAQWIGFGFEMAITLVGVALTLGAGAGNAAAKAGEVASKAAQIASKVEKFANIATKATTVIGGAASVTGGALAIAESKYEFDAAEALSNQKDIQAILDRVTQAIDMDTKFLEAIMKRAQELMEKVSEIVEQNNQAQATITTGQTPAMA
jgi:hypothetical protein